eukprot:2064439-Pleurochrysis_carterae.AAC.1
MPHIRRCIIHPVRDKWHVPPLSLLTHLTVFTSDVGNACMFSVFFVKTQSGGGGCASPWKIEARFLLSMDVCVWKDVYEQEFVPEMQRK